MSWLDFFRSAREPSPPVSIAAANALKRLELIRSPSGSQGTLGQIISGNKRLCYTLELPWKNNVKRVSCIPAGSYLCEMRRSPKFGPVYEVTGVPNRSNILLHTGNWAGDVGLNFRSDVLGCIVLGLYAGVLKGQRAVFVSRPAVTALQEAMASKPFTLEIRWASSTSSLAA